MGLTHFDEHGNSRMVDVSDKDITKRIAIAKGKIQVGEEVMKHILTGSVEKGRSEERRVEKECRSRGSPYH